MKRGDILLGKQTLYVHTDGAIRPELGLSGLAAIVRDEQKRVRFLWCRRAGRLTCNEAEYAAVIMALEGLYRLHARRVLIYSDSRILVDQMSGRAAVHAATLKPVHARLCALVSNFDQITFQHIPRLHNRLADALANDVAEGLEKEHA